MRAAILFVLALAAGCGSKTSATEEKGGKRGRGALTFAVDVMKVASKKVPYIVEAPGTVEAFERVQVTARVAGAVDKVAFSEGQEVKKGDTLVVIDSERFRVAMNSAKADLDRANASLADNQAMVKRREDATKDHPGLIPGEEIATYKTKVATSRADRDVAQASMRAAELNLRDSAVRAPMDGVIQTRTVETGQFVPTGYVMATLLRADPLLLRFNVEPAEAPRIKPGMIASFTMRETLRTYTAKITLVAASADPVTHMVAATGEVQAEEHKFWLRPGSFCDVTISLDAQREAPLIPRSSARATDHGYVAYVIDGGVAHEHVLKLGMSTRDGWVEVRSGLAAGDALVVQGAEALVEGAKVVQKEVTEESLRQRAAADAGAAAAAPSAPPNPSATPAASGAPK